MARLVIRWLIFAPMFVLMVGVLLAVWPLMSLFAWLDKESFGWSDVREMASELAANMRFQEGV